MRATTRPASLVVLFLTTVCAASVARAQEEPSADATSPTPRADYRFELGLFGGLHLFDSEHGLGRFKDDPPELSPRDNVTFGLRLGFNFNRWLAFEGEASGIPTQTVDKT